MKSGGSRSSAALRVGVLAVMLLAIGCGQRVVVERILLVTLDTTRADRLGAFGYEQAHTPTIDQLAREGVAFDAARTPAPVTLPSHASILTGLHPPAHGVRDNSVFVLSEQATLVSEVLRDRGWRTAAFVGAYILDSRFGLSQGFEVYGDAPAGQIGEVLSVSRPADAVVDAALAWLDTVQADEPYLLWVHFYDPHQPHEAPAPWRERVPDAYDATIAFADAELGRLLEQLRERGLAENLVTIVAGDHGESLGQHGEFSHGVFLYEPVMRVPLVISGGPVEAGVRVARDVSLSALPATILNLAAVPLATMPDSAMSALLGADGGAVREGDEGGVYLETLTPYYSHNWRASRGVVWRGHKWIEGSKPELYDLANDPGESDNLAEREPALAAELAAELARQLARHAPLGWSHNRNVEPEEAEMLEALGYGGSGVGLDDDPFAPALVDPHDRIVDLAELDRVAMLSRLGRTAREVARRTPERKSELESQAKLLDLAAGQLLQKLHARNPDDPDIGQRYAAVARRSGRPEIAVLLMEQVAARRPTSPVTKFNLGRAYGADGRTGEAVAAMEQAVAIEPAYQAPYDWLAAHYQRQRDGERALQWLERQLAQLETGSRRHTLVARRAERARLVVEHVRSSRATPSED